jgi:VanZ family protein
MRRLARGSFWILLAIITVLALYPRLTLPEPELTEGSTQYYNHVLAFVTLQVVGAIAWGLRRRLISGLALYAVAIELAQSLSPGRETSLDDLAASLAGMVIGSALVGLARGASRLFSGHDVKIR